MSEVPTSPGTARIGTSPFVRAVARAVIGGFLLTLAATITLAILTGDLTHPMRLTVLASCPLMGLLLVPGALIEGRLARPVETPIVGALLAAAVIFVLGSFGSLLVWLEVVYTSEIVRGGEVADALAAVRAFVGKIVEEPLVYAAPYPLVGAPVALVSLVRGLRLPLAVQVLLAGPLSGGCTCGGTLVALGGKDIHVAAVLAGGVVVVAGLLPPFFLLTDALERRVDLWRGRAVR